MVGSESSIFQKPQTQQPNPNPKPRCFEFLVFWTFEKIFGPECQRPPFSKYRGSHGMACRNGGSWSPAQSSEGPGDAARKSYHRRAPSRSCLRRRSQGRSQRIWGSRAQRPYVWTEASPGDTSERSLKLMPGPWRGGIPKLRDWVATRNGLRSQFGFREPNPNAKPPDVIRSSALRKVG
eukprot:s4048_g2.t1